MLCYTRRTTNCKERAVLINHCRSHSVVDHRLQEHKQTDNNTFRFFWSLRIIHRPSLVAWTDLKTVYTTNEKQFAWTSSTTSFSAGFNIAAIYSCRHTREVAINPADLFVTFVALTLNAYLKDLRHVSRQFSKDSIQVSRQTIHLYTERCELVWCSTRGSSGSRH